LDETCKNDVPEQLIDNLKLVENGYLKRAALLLFHPDPEKFITGAYIKIGFFKNDADLLFQDDIHGNLFEQVERTLELILTKYTKALINYKGLSRIETYEYPIEALREALLNAVAHKDYSGGVPIQIRVYNDKLRFWNHGQLPQDWTIETLLNAHPSIPYNPDIANAFFRSGYIGSWGRGIEKIRDYCKAATLPEPIFIYRTSGFWVEFRKDIYNEDSLKEMELNERQINALLFFKNKGEILTSMYMQQCNVSERTARNDLMELVDKELLVKQGSLKTAKYLYK
jgi:ATP-dependent DNA helicase RecG